jgi:DNA-binding NarL/FixJ family response regulator
VPFGAAWVTACSKYQCPVLRLILPGHASPAPGDPVLVRRARRRTRARIRHTERSMTTLERARDAFLRRAWGEAFTGFAESAAARSLGPDDLERFAVAAYLTGRDDACAEAWEEAHRRALDAGDVATSARYGFWLAMTLMMHGQMALAAGWLTRSKDVLASTDIECAATGFVLIPEFLERLDAGDAEAARDLAVRAIDLGERSGDADLVAFGKLAHGQALIALGDVDAGIARLDDVMISVTSGDVGPITTGLVYCAVILECIALFDMPRAAQWTRALGNWCDAQPDLVPYRGQCLVHRSQVQQTSGEWSEAIASARDACVRLTEPPHPALGLAHYQQGELNRLVGSLPEAERDYGNASRCGYDPMPGLALLKLAQGDGVGARAAIARALAETTGVQRPALLHAAVEVFRATGDIVAAREASDELVSIASRSSSDLLRALSSQASGAVLLGEGDPAAALPRLREAASAMGPLYMPYEAARTAVLRGLACSALGDTASAVLEFESAKDAFDSLGAVPDSQRVAELLGRSARAGDSRRTGSRALSDREREVLAHVAAGQTNAEIAAELNISVHTVGRHLENIFAKLGVTSRAAATSYAYENNLIAKRDA